MKARLAFILVLAIFSSCQKQRFHLIIKNANIYDGSGGAAVKADIGINADTIAFIGDLSEAVAPDIVNANGLSLAPGFIDAHSHHDRGFEESRDVLGAISQ